MDGELEPYCQFKATDCGDYGRAFDAQRLDKAFIGVRSV